MSSIEEEIRNRKSEAPVYLSPWDEARGRLRRIDRERGEIVLEIRKEFRIRLPPEKLDDLNDSVGDKISILRTDGSELDEFLLKLEVEE